jgi:NAD-dependent dihydropyrimidine dehydrogenase PreA subunit
MTVSIDATKCNGCATCIESCPVDVLRTDSITGKAFAAYEGDCHVCCLCEDDCPTGAIEIDYAIANRRQRSIYDTLGLADPHAPQRSDGGDDVTNVQASPSPP